MLPRLMPVKTRPISSSGGEPARRTATQRLVRGAAHLRRRARRSCRPSARAAQQQRLGGSDCCSRRARGSPRCALRLVRSTSSMAACVQRQQLLDLGVASPRPAPSRSAAACPRRRRSAAPWPRRERVAARARRASARRCAVPSSRRTRLLTTFIRGSSGSGLTVLPVSRSRRQVVLDQEHLVLADRLHVAVEQRLQQAAAPARSPLVVSASIAAIFASLSPKASARTVCGAIAARARCTQQSERRSRATRSAAIRR